ncbi:MULTISPECIES: SSI family serine proteinase inhibitor [Thermomonosporaceae]|uniref:SSI family serine proteinase inhibitor n=1 Tax=Thermomonosporaceae TaxID=2012 RepID=UPI00255B1BE0|nr:MULTISPECIES: SSI family serine proteinase inhibitor [Thermomonosporaceae]MDL4772630.1 SSI family serine proteinase inhibitor [Actinomadura xylanilytica]
MPHLVATALAGAALALLPAVPAGAATRPATAPAAVGRLPAAGTSLRLTLTYPGAAASGTRSVTLSCDPPGGSHPEAARACAQLSRSGGKFTREPADIACTTIYSPVVAKADGLWRGRPARFRAEYANDCALHASTGAIFAF